MYFLLLYLTKHWKQSGSNENFSWQISTSYSIEYSRVKQFQQFFPPASRYWPPLYLCWSLMFVRWLFCMASFIRQHRLYSRFEELETGKAFELFFVLHWKPCPRFLQFQFQLYKKVLPQILNTALIEPFCTVVMVGISKWVKAHCVIEHKQIVKILLVLGYNDVTSTLSFSTFVTSGQSSNCEKSKGSIWKSHSRMKMFLNMWPTKESY